MILLTDITTSGDGIETTPVDSLHSGLEVLLDNTVELEGLIVSTQSTSRRRGLTCRVVNLKVEFPCSSEMASMCSHCSGVQTPPGSRTRIMKE
jgi:hypothetical protein